MKPSAWMLIVLLAMLACNLTPAGTGGSPVPADTLPPAPPIVSPPPAATAAQYAQDLIAYYPLAADLDDVTGRNGPLTAENAPMQPGGGLFCNGIYPATDPATGCTIMTPVLPELDLGAFTISAQFLVPGAWSKENPVFVGGGSWRWLGYVLETDGSITLMYNNSSGVACPAAYTLNEWHEAVITYDGATASLYLDKTLLCTAAAALETGDDRQILTDNLSNGTNFYGTIRELRIYNGVVTPAEIPFP